MSRHLATAALVSLALLAGSPPATAACRVSDFTDRTLTSLNPMQRLAFASQMLETEFERLRAEPPGSPNHDALIAGAGSFVEARQTALSRLESLELENIDGLRHIWASDFLSDEELRSFTDCVSARQPGITFAGRPASPGRFHLTLSHRTPIGIEKISIRLVASYNVANADEFEALLDGLGKWDNFTARTYALERRDPDKRAVVVLRAGWETPQFVYMPVYPTPDYFAGSPAAKDRGGASR